MATKLSNYHVSILLNECKEYYILDTYIALSHISSDIKGKYIIQTSDDSKSTLVNLVKRFCTTATYRTIFNCIDKLIDLNILEYSTTLKGWTLVNMEKMTLSLDEASDEDKALAKGYTHIRKLFLTEEFNKMKFREKRLIIYLAQLKDSKSSNNYNEFKVNLLKNNSSWMKVLRTKCKYYAKYTITNLLNKYKDIFEDVSEKLREKDLAPSSVTNFKFSFKCLAVEKKNDITNEELDLMMMYYPKEYNLVKDKLNFFDITLSNTKVMHIVRAIANVSQWFLKEQIVQIIINKYVAIKKYKSRENIKSLPAYIAAVVKAVIEEYTTLKNSVEPKTIISNFNLDDDYINIASKEIEYIF